MHNMQGFSDIRILKRYSNRDLEIHGRNWNFFFVFKLFPLIANYNSANNRNKHYLFFFLVLICKLLLIYKQFETKSNPWLAIAHLGQIISLSYKELIGTHTPICPWNWCTLKLRYTQTEIHLGIPRKYYKGFVTKKLHTVEASIQLVH